MPARLILIHEDQTIREALAAVLRAEGHYVTEFDELTIPVDAPRPANTIEVALFRAKGERPRIRLRITGFPRDQPYAGPLGSFVPEPVTVGAVLSALRLMLLGSTVR